MPVDTSEVLKRLSGGASNTDPTLSLGGAKSSTAIIDNTLHNFFPLVTSSMSSLGEDRYLCFYIHNSDGTIAMDAVKVYISQDSTASNHEYDIGLGSSAVNGTEQTITDIFTAPTGGVTFSHPTSDGTGLSIATIPAGQHKAIWVKEVITAGAGAFNNSTSILSIAYDTSA